MRVPTITRPYWPGRSVGARTLPITLQPEPVPVAPTAYRGGFSNVVAGSAAIIDGEATNPGRGFMGRTADTLETGPAPDRINRNTTARASGYIGGAGGAIGMGGWPYDGNALLVPHTTIPRTPITVTPFARTIDTGVTVPALPIGGIL